MIPAWWVLRRKFRCFHSCHLAPGKAYTVGLDTSIRLGCSPAGRVVKLVYTADLKSAALTERTGSSPVAATKSLLKYCEALSTSASLPGLFRQSMSPQRYANGSRCAADCCAERDLFFADRWITGTSQVMTGWGERDRREGLWGVANRSCFCLFLHPNLS